MKSQKEQILAYLKKSKNGLTQLQALNMFGCFRLASRINDLHRDGHKIDCELFFDAKTNKRYGKYTLKK